MYRLYIHCQYWCGVEPQTDPETQLADLLYDTNQSHKEGSRWMDEHEFAGRKARQPTVTYLYLEADHLT